MHAMLLQADHLLLGAHFLSLALPPCWSRGHEAICKNWAALSLYEFKTLWLWTLRVMSCNHLFQVSCSFDYALSQPEHQLRLGLGSCNPSTLNLKAVSPHGCRLLPFRESGHPWRAIITVHDSLLWALQGLHLCQLVQ